MTTKFTQLDDEIRGLIVRDILHRGMLLRTVGGGISLAQCQCGYLAEVDWDDASFGQLHGCTFTDLKARGEKAEGR